MANERRIELFSAGCGACEETFTLVNSIACSSCEVSVLDMKDKNVASRAKQLGITKVPAVVIDGKLADCCSDIGVDKATLQALGIGKP